MIVSGAAAPSRRLVGVEPLESRHLLAAVATTGAADAPQLAAATSTSPRIMENLGRGVVATRASSSQVFVSWRSLALDPAGMGFNVYRSANGGTAVKLNSSPLTGGTNYTDSTANATLANRYYVRPVVGGIEQPASSSYTLKANTAIEPLFSIPLRNITGTASDYRVEFTWVGDLDGNGEYDFVVDRVPVLAGLTEIVEAYNQDGTFLWAYNAGPNSLNRNNIEPGSTTLATGNWDGMTVFDLDSDGKAEVLIRTANGAVFGDQATLAYPVNDNVQFISVLNGMTGAEQARVQVPTDYLPDGPMAASMGVGYLDGVNPSLLVKMKNRIVSGHFNQMVLAYDFNGASITQKWKFTRGTADLPDGHQIRIVDVDQDGKDEYVDIGFVLNGDGTLKYSMAPQGIVHGDRFHIGDFDPDRPGLEGYGVQQNNPSFLREYYYDAATGQLLHTRFGTDVVDVGRGVAADIDPNHRGFEYWSFSGIYNSKTPVAGQAPVETKLADEPNRPWPNFGIWWDGDVLAENLNNTVIDNWNPATQTTSRVSTLYHYGATEVSGEAPTFYGDILGDWREEVIYEHWDHTRLLIYTTQIASSTRLYTLAQNPYYRNGLTIKGYQQSNQIDYYLGNGMATPPTPNIELVGATANAAPTVASPASASPNPPSGTTTTTNLSVLGADDDGEANLTYTWSAAGPGVVNFSANGSNAARNSVATFNLGGTYTLTATIRDAAGRRTTSSVDVTVSQLLPQAWWKIDETGGPAVADASGNLNHGTAVNDPTRVAGKFGNALSFDGVDDYVDLPTSIVNTVAGSVSMWVKTGANFPDLAPLFYISGEDYGNGGGSEPELHVNFTSNERIQLFIEGGTTDVNIASTSAYADDAWHHVAATWDLSGNAVLYVDGVQVNSAVHDASSFTGGVHTYLCRPTLPTRFYTGLMDDVRLYNVALSPSQVQALYSGVATGSITGRAFHDKNGDGVFAAGDVGIGNATVFLDADGEGDLDPGETTAFTDSAGAYSFGNVAAGTYAVRQVAQSEFAVANSNTAVVVAGGTSANNDFANARIVYHGTAGADDYRLRKNAGEKFEIVIGGALAYTVFAAAPSLTFDLLDGDDLLTLDFAGGAPVPAGHVSYDAGAGSDQLAIVMTGAADTIAFDAAGVAFAGVAGALQHASLDAVRFDGNGGWDNITVNGGPAVTFADAQQLQSLQLAGPAVARFAVGAGTSVTRGLLLGDAVTLDLANATLIFDTTDPDVAGAWDGAAYTGLLGRVAAGYNYGAWDGAGIVTTRPDAAAGLTTVGIATGEQVLGLGATDTDVFAGVTVSGRSVILRYTYAGDANLDGQIDAGDYGVLDAYVQIEGASGYANGDFNLDGFIDAADYGTIDNSIQYQGTPL